MKNASSLLDRIIITNFYNKYWTGEPLRGDVLDALLDKYYAYGVKISYAPNTMVDDPNDFTSIRPSNYDPILHLQDTTSINIATIIHVFSAILYLIHNGQLDPRVLNTASEPEAP